MATPTFPGRRLFPLAIGTVVAILVTVPLLNLSRITTAYYGYQANKAVEAGDWDTFIKYAESLTQMGKEEVAEGLLIEHRATILKGRYGIPSTLDAYSFPLFLSCLKDEDKEVRMKGLSGLGRLYVMSNPHEVAPPPKFLDVLPLLVALLSDPEEEIRTSAYNVIFAMDINPWALQQETDPSIVDAPTTPTELNKR